MRLIEILFATFNSSASLKLAKMVVAEVSLLSILFENYVERDEVKS